MKQKRKVKSLLPQKNFVNGRILTILLVVLSLVLCVWWVSLLTHSAFAEEGEDWQYSVTVNYRYRNRAGTVTGVLERSITKRYNNGAYYSIPSPKHSGYVCFPENVTGVVNNANVMEYVYYTPEEDINSSGRPDGEELCELQTVCRDEYGGRINDCWSILGKDYIRGVTYQIPVPGGIVNYVPAMTGVSFKVNTGLYIDIVYLPYNKDFNNNGVADRDEYNITMNYTCKLCGRKEYECSIPQKKLLAPKNDITQTSQDDVSFPWYRIDYEPSIVLPGYDGEEFDITVKLTPERDQNNDCVYDWEQELWEITEFDYTWLDNKVEVLYGMRFLDPSDFTKVVNSIFMSGSSLYISPNPVVVNGNTVDTGVYSHILWWENNEVYSNNITLIAWSNNKIHAWNDNASVLWWNGNEVMSWKSGWIPAILVGWELNKMGTGHDGNALIWWKRNNIEEGHSNVFILWWENNIILWKDEENWFETPSKNAIIWWKNVKLVGFDDVFVYSNIDGRFSPASHKAFYLNVGSGVWISTGWIEWLSVGGAVSIWRVDINNTNTWCDNSSLWVIWSYSGCLVWCTDAWLKAGAKWELLDQWNECAEICENNSGHCLNQDVEVVNVEDYDAQCTTWVVNTDNAHLCIDDLDSYKNVIFESSLIDSDEECPTGQNICVYQCDEGYHLTWDSEWIGCYSDCKLPWDETKAIKHNETVFGYNIENVSCSNDVYVFPLETEIINKWQPGPMYTIWNVNRNGEWYYNRAKYWKSYESCGNYDHKKTLICYKWILYLTLTGNDGKPDFSTAEEAKKYNHESCYLHNYRCDDSVYTLTSGQILNDRNDGPQNGGSREVADRGILTWNRWLYGACIDFAADPSDPTKNGELCNTWTYRYHFIGCREGYFLGDDGICKKDCSLKGKNWNLETYRNNEEVIGYQVTSAQCPDECTWSNLVCNDGDWHIGSKTGLLATGIWYNYCNWGKKTCDSNVYNVTQTIHDQYSGDSIYTGCVSYNVNGNKCSTGDTNYKLINCRTDNHTENMRWCISNTKWEQCKKGEKPKNSNYVIVDVPITWSGSWNTGNWTEPEDCKWTCNDGYTTGSDGKSCVLAECWEELNTCKNGVNATWAWSDDSASWWKCGSKTCSLCKDGYHPVGSGDTPPYCEKNENGVCGTGHYNCLWGVKNERNEWLSWWVAYFWDCLGVGSGTTDDLWCVECAEWYLQDGKTCKKVENGVCGASRYICETWSPTNTGENDSEYYWDCEGENWWDNAEWCKECKLWRDENGNCVNDNSIDWYQICRSTTYITGTYGGNATEYTSLSKVKFYSVDQRPLPIKVEVHQNLIYKYTEGRGNQNDDCMEIEVIKTWDIVSTTQTPKGSWSLAVQSCFNKRAAARGLDGWTYWDLDGNPEIITRDDVSFVPGFDCLMPRCGSVEKSCADWFMTGYNESDETRKCVYWNKEVSCRYKCVDTKKCPIGYKEQGDECKLYAKYCADPARTSCGWWNLVHLNSASCFWLSDWQVNEPDWSIWNWPSKLNLFSVCIGQYFSDPQNNLYTLSPQYTDSICDDDLDLNTVLNECFDGLKHYYVNYNTYDNWYYIDQCAKVPATATKCVVDRNCRVISGWSGLNL